MKYASQDLFPEAALRLQNFEAPNGTAILASIADRTVIICGNTLYAPDYYSWNAAGQGNIYTNYYSYKYLNPGCGKYDWTLVTPQQKLRTAYATEHVYELQMLNLFITYMGTQNSQLEDWLNGRDVCSGIIQRLLFMKGGSWTTVGFNGGVGTNGDGVNPGTRPVDELVGEMSGGLGQPGDRSDEMMYLDTTLNGFKAKLFTPGSSLPSPSSQTYTARLEAVAQLSAVYLYLNDPTVRNVFKTVSLRVYNFWVKIDTACAAATAGICKIGPGFSWAKSYELFEIKFLGGMDDKALTYRNTHVTAAMDLINTAVQRGAVSSVTRDLMFRNIAQRELDTLNPTPPGTFSCLTALEMDV